jgi:hypothetical protein
MGWTLIIFDPIFDSKSTFSAQSGSGMWGRPRCQFSKSMSLGTTPVGKHRFGTHPKNSQGLHISSNPPKKVRHVIYNYFEIGFYFLHQ